MPGLPLDVPMVWLGTAIVTTTLVGLALQLPTATPARAGTVAETIDGVAAAPYPSSASHPLDAGAIKLRPHRIALRSPHGVSHATLGFGPVTPARTGSKLHRILRGTPASVVFDSPEQLEAHATAARDAPAEWVEPGQTLYVRRVAWGGVNVTLVGV